MADVLQHVRNQMSRWGIEADQRIVVAVSGGPDSMALLSILQSLGYAVAAAHVNYNLRGADSAADEALVQDYCEKHHIPLHVERLVDFKGPNLQARAREARLAFFEQWRHAYDYLALAHHRQDAREGFFIHLFRGSNPNSLSNPKPRDGWRIRPLLGVDKVDLLAWNEQHGVPWRQDLSNHEDVYLRNRLRNKLFPLLDELMPGWENGLDRSLYHLARNEDYPRWQAWIVAHQRTVGPLHILPAGVPNPLEAFDLVWLWTAAVVHFDPDVLALWMSAGRGKRLVKNGWTLEKGGQYHLLYREEACYWHPDPSLSSDWTMPAWMQLFLPQSEVHQEVSLRRPAQGFSIRTRQTGDYFYPQGGKGRRLVSDYLTDLKLPRVVKDALPLLVAEGQIAWVIGLRPDERWVTEINAKNAYLGRLI